MEIIKQTADNTCVACVLAMMVKESEKYVLDWFVHKDPPFSDLDVFIFLAHHGIFLAFHIECPSFDGTGIDLSKIDHLEVQVGINKQSAYMVVGSPFGFGRTHAVFWNGKNILDPLHEKPQALNKYKVKELYPITMTEQRYNININNIKD